MQKQQLKHFSHRHPLELSEIHEEDHAICSGCELDLSGLAYICTKPTCNFILHDPCSELPRQIRHKSHPKHPLTLLFSPPYGDGEFTCDACGNSGFCFTFHCSTCEFDLHVDCASLPEIEARDDHQHPLILIYSFPGDESFDCCYLCNEPVGNAGWVYYCEACNCGTHLECVLV